MNSAKKRGDVKRKHRALSVTETVEMRKKCMLVGEHYFICFSFGDLVSLKNCARIYFMLNIYSTYNHKKSDTPMVRRLPDF